MAEQQSFQERTEQPTAKRRRDAREKGDVPRSRELNTTLVMLTGAALMAGAGAYILADLRDLLRAGLSLSPADLLIVEPQVHFAGAVSRWLTALAPLFIVLSLAAVAGPALTGGWIFRLANAAPKASKLNPAAGLKRIFGPQGLMELLKALAKFIVVLGAATTVMWFSRDRLFDLAAAPLAYALSSSASLLVATFALVSAALILIAGVDVPFQLWQFQKKLRMTKQEVKEELKDTEGRPEVKSRIRQLQQEVSRRRIAAEMPTATVLIVNPVHFGVALRYIEGQRAPVVVAKGADLLVQRMRELAREHRIPIVSAPPLARAIYYATRPGQEVPAELYAVVARVLAWVYEIKRRPGAGLRMPAVESSDIPEALRR